MNATFYSSPKLQLEFSEKVSKENPKPKGNSRIMRSNSEVLRELQMLYILHGESLFEDQKIKI